MTRIRYVYFFLIYFLKEVGNSSSKKVTIGTKFTGLRDDYNLGHLGYVYLKSEATIPELEISGCQHYDVNRTTCNFIDNSPKSDSDVMVLRAWIALTLRDNILVLLGYLIHQSTNESFSHETRSSLRLLYEEIRRNNVKTMDLLPRLKNIGKTSQVSQVLSLIKSLRNVSPSYCQSMIDEIGKEFVKRKELLRNILGAQRGIDLFADIGLQMVPMSRTKSTRKKYDPEVALLMGKEFAIFFAAVQQGRVVLTQSVLAVFMLNMRFIGMSTLDNEDFRFICDALRLNKIPNWLPGFTDSCCGNFKDPYELVQTMLRTIIERTKADTLIKNTIIELLPRLVQVPKTDLATRRIDRFFANSNFNVSLFIEMLLDEVTIPEDDTFRRFVDNGTIDLAYAFKGFVRYFYDTPRELVYAFMKRIRYRVPMSDDAKFLVDAILLDLRERYRLSPNYETNAKDRVPLIQ